MSGGADSSRTFTTFVQDQMTLAGTLFAPRAGVAGVSTVVSNTSGMTVAGYQTLIAGSGSGVLVYTGPEDTVSLAEHHLYGSSRLGLQTYGWGEAKSVWREYLGWVDTGLSRRLPWYSVGYGDLVNKNVNQEWGRGDSTQNYPMARRVGLRYYELSDHLGNVLATVLDRKTGILASGSSTVYDRWKADVASLTDYYPFGMQLPGRIYEAGIGLTSKFGFNGKINDDDPYGLAKIQDFGSRIYLNGIARWLSADRMNKPNCSPYNFVANNPLIFIDPDGNTEFYSLSKWIGTDGIDNNIRTIIRSAEVQEYIEKETKQGHTVVIPASMDANPFVLPPDDALNKTVQIFAIGSRPEEERRETWSVMKLDQSGHSAQQIAEGRGTVYAPDGSVVEQGTNMPNGDIAIHNHPIGIQNVGRQAKSNDVFTATPVDVGLRSKYMYFITVGKIGTILQPLAADQTDPRGNGVRIQTPGDEVKLNLSVISDMISNKRGKLGRKFESKRAQQGSQTNLD